MIFENFKIQIVEVYQIENVIQFNLFSSDQLTKLIKYICYNFKN